MALIPNNGWETGNAGGWTFNNGGGGGSATVVTTAPRSGLYHLRLNSVTGFSSTSVTVQFADHAALRGYQVTFTVRGYRVSGTRTANIQISDGVGGATITNLSTGSSYAEASATRTINALSTVLQFSITQAGSGGGVHHVDDMEVVVKDAGGNVVFASDLLAAPGAAAVAIPGIEVDWDQDDVWSDSGSAISSDVLTREGAVVSFERGTEDLDDDRAPVGVASIVVKNADGKYSPENAASALSPNVKPRRRIRLRAIFNGTLYDLWKGYIVRFVPDPNPRRPVCTILCEDGMGWLGNPDSRINAPQGSPLSDVKLGATTGVGGPLKAILDAAGWPAADRTLDEGVDRIGPWWVTDAVPRSAIQDLMKMEGSLAFIASDGKFTYKDRHARIKGDGLVSQATFSDDMRALGYEYGQDSIINKAIITGVVREAAAAQTYVYGLKDRIRVEPAEVFELWATLSSPGENVTAPVPNTDWKANLVRDGSGTDQTANVTVAALQFGQVVRLRVTNNHTRAVWIIPGTSDADETLRIRAYVYAESNLYREDSDATSITAYQQRSAKVDTLFIGNARRLESHATFIVADRKDPRAQYPRMTILSNSSTLRLEALTLDVSDRITVTVTDLGITSQAYHINKVAHRIWNGGVQHEVTYWLSKVGLENFFRVGVSQIGGSAAIAF